MPENRQWGMMTPEIQDKLRTEPTIRAEVGSTVVQVVFDVKRDGQGPHAAYSLTQDSNGKVVSETVGIGRTEDDALGAAVGMIAHRTLGQELRKLREADRKVDLTRKKKKIRMSEYVAD